MQSIFKKKYQFTYKQSKKYNEFLIMQFNIHNLTLIYLIVNTTIQNSIFNLEVYKNGKTTNYGDNKFHIFKYISTYPTKRSNCLRINNKF